MTINENYLRTWRNKELGFRLDLFDTGRTGPLGHTYLAYRFTEEDDEVIFQGDDYGVPAGTAIDSLEAVEGLLGFLSLRPGDTDLDYFDGYNQRQWRFVEEHAEDLQMLVNDIAEEQVRTCDRCGLIESHEDGGEDWPHGICDECVTPIPTDRIRADELLVTDEVWYPTIWETYSGGPVRSLKLIGDDVEVVVCALYGGDGKDHEFITSQGNEVRITPREERT